MTAELKFRVVPAASLRKPRAWMAEKAAGEVIFETHAHGAYILRRRGWWTTPLIIQPALTAPVGSDLAALEGALSKAIAEFGQANVAKMLATPPAAPARDGRNWSLLEATQESLRLHSAEIRKLRAIILAAEKQSLVTQEPRWYCIDAEGFAEPAESERSAREIAKQKEKDFPCEGPYRVAQLCECGTVGGT